MLMSMAHSLGILGVKFSWWGGGVNP